MNKMEDHEEAVSSVAFSSDCKYLVTGSYDKTFKIWSTESSFELISTSECHKNFILSIAFSPDGKYLATCSADTTCKIWK